MTGITREDLESLQIRALEIIDRANTDLRSAARGKGRERIQNVYVPLIRVGRRVKEDILKYMAWTDFVNDEELSKGVDKDYIDTRTKDVVTRSLLSIRDGLLILESRIDIAEAEVGIRGFYAGENGTAKFIEGYKGALIELEGLMKEAKAKLRPGYKRVKE